MIYDYLIIGGGMAGASAAYTLSNHGSVVVLEAEDTAGYHATGRSAALFTRNFGGAIVRQINAASLAFLRTPPEGFSDTPLLSRRGLLAVAGTADADSLDTVLAMSEPGEEVVEIDPQTACEMVPFLRRDLVARAAYEANVADIDVATLHLSYLKAARRRETQVLTKQSVKDLGRDDDGWRVQTATDSFSAKTVINAAGAWADQIGVLAGAQSIGLVPKRRTAILLKPPQGMDCTAIPAVDFAGSDAYLKPDAGLIMASPGDATPVDPHDAWADDMDIAVLADWIERQTTIKVDRIEHSWAGLRSFVADDAPVVGFDRKVPDFFWLAGQGGYGIMMAPALAEITATLISGGPADAVAQVLSPDRLS